MTYTINGKDCTEFEINKRCAELMGLKLCDGQHYKPSVAYWDITGGCSQYKPCINWNDAGPIIEKCWDELMMMVDDSGNNSLYDRFYTRWEYLIDKYKCSKLVAACICFIQSASS